MECNPEMVERFKIVSEEEFNRLAEPQSTIVEGDTADKLAELKRRLEEKN
jgi:hypothetical protein